MNALRKAVTVGSIVPLAAGALLVSAPNAAAVGSGACTINGENSMTRVSANNVNLRTGPGTRYTSRGHLKKGTNFWYYCTKRTGPGAKGWHYGKVSSGTHKGKKGWVYSTYIRA